MVWEKNPPSLDASQDKGYSKALHDLSFNSLHKNVCDLLLGIGTWYCMVYVICIVLFAIAYCRATKDGNLFKIIFRASAERVQALPINLRYIYKRVFH